MGSRRLPGRRSSRSPGPWRPTPPARIHVAADRAWLGSQPPALLLAPPTDADGEALADWLRRAERLGAPPAGETDGAATPEDREAENPVSGQRDLLSLLRDRWLERGYLAASVQADSTGTALVLLVDPGPLHTLARSRSRGRRSPAGRVCSTSGCPARAIPSCPRSISSWPPRWSLACAERGYPFPIWLTRTLTIDPAQRDGVDHGGPGAGPAHGRRAAAIEPAGRPGRGLPDPRRRSARGPASSASPT
jgi:hypothetical protein